MIQQDSNCRLTFPRKDALPHRTVSPNNLVPLFLLMIGLFLSACTLDTSGRSIPDGFVLLEQPASSENRLVVLGSDGNIYTMHPDGSDRRWVTNDASARRQYTQPTWSPNSERIVYSALERHGENMTMSLVTSRFDGAEKRDLELPFAPFYYHWSPDGQRLVYLSSWLDENRPSMALRLVEFSSGQAEDATLAQGQPFYFSWSPSGEQLLTHVGNESVAIQSIDGEAEMLSMTSTGFPAPQWLADGETLVYAVDQDGINQLILADLAGNALREITAYTDGISFTVSPTNERLAYTVSDTNTGSAAVGELYVVNINTGRTQELSSDPVVAFFWSPDGNKLAYQVVERSAGGIGLRWHVWDGTEITEYGSFLPSQRFFQRYLMFFDQYAQSMSIWAPDSSAFVYAGTTRTGQRGIWVQYLGEPRPTRVARGIFAAWSPR